ncbi:homoserine O-acetyltransferase MetA [Anaerostipes sp.]|uniref:homoserine O-acetyltransferase MetA n=1 Tax=Anaerostipes sp. TaxID=1872530 RepID=UPI0025C15412|nr:homoserine O-succinyltransferase [Anaerostipes sp.]MBS7007549.1 homoserine O-succinyltransferase [Anaerostipes sp.]
MPIRIDTDLPARAILEEENVFVMDTDRAVTQDIRPLRIAILNLMPNKLDTELHLLRSLSNTPLQIDITFLKTASYEPTHVPESHMEKFYVYFEDVQDKKFDGMIITGAPVELKEFEDVDYWDEVAEIMEWTKKNVTSTLHICWAAQAGLYYHYNVRKNVLDQKISGVYRHYPLHKKTPLVRGFDDYFYVPHSRNTGVDGEAIRQCKELTVVAESEETGPYLILNETGSQIFVTGHPEYDVMSLHQEYVRDINRGLNPEIPKNYYLDDDPKKGPVKSWRCHANAMYYNWLNYYVYQATPYDL